MRRGYTHRSSRIGFATVGVLSLWLLTQSFSQPLVEELAIEVKGVSREFAFTNKETAFFIGETHAENRSVWQGFSVFGHTFVHDYDIWIEEKRLDRSSARSVVVYPDYLKRLYPGGIVEELRLVDSLALFSVTVTAPQPVHIDVIPLFSEGARDYVTRFREQLVLLACTSHLARTEQRPYPVWLAIHGAGFLPQRKSTQRQNNFSPVIVAGRKATTHVLVFSVGDTPEEAVQHARSYLKHKDRYHRVRRERMERLLRETFVETENADFNKALAWAKLSLDALLMNQRTKGIFAGLPWFNNYWGRDTFIALPGATLVLGRFGEAKEILLSFAAHQQGDSTSHDYGRIPNIITTTDRAYNTADGTPRFVMMAREYVERSGDTAFMSAIYPTIVRSIEGTLRHHCDSLGFLTHGDAETWMDAVGPDGPWSPRGNRANDVQALWAQQLEAGVWFATQLQDSSRAQRWRDHRLHLRQNFLRFFIHHGQVVDHLRRDGSPDNRLRPNQIFTAQLLPEELRAQVVQTVVSKLTYEYGVASLSQEDDDFHPYHLYPPYYPKDAAYHNGVVWTWLQGPLISELCHFNEHDFAFRLTQNAIHQILDRGAVGTQSELLDALPRANEHEPLLSGTISQAWNLAEFIRNFYNDYLGTRVSLLNHHLVLRPRIPKALGTVKAVINLNGRALPIEIGSTNETTSVRIDGSNLRKGGTAEIHLLMDDSQEISGTFKVRPNSHIFITLCDSILSIVSEGVRDSFISKTINNAAALSSRSPLAFVAPSLRAGLKALRPPDYPLVPHSTIKAFNPVARSVVWVDDPRGDDNGTGAFTYPLSPHFKKGGFDITRFAVSTDDSMAYFELQFAALANPGWHLEYGFQLTFIAIAIDEDGIENSGRRLVGRNANFILPPRRAYERIIYVGGGVQLEDKDGRVLAAYVPKEEDVSHPLGDAERGVIRFALPTKYLGTPTEKWTFTVLVGGQDDHGGAGLGEFRTVREKASEWHGGGRMRMDEPNVYDVLETR